MTRHSPDMRITRDEWTDGDRIAVGIAFIVGLIAVIGVISLLAGAVRL